MWGQAAIAANFSGGDDAVGAIARIIENTGMFGQSAREVLSTVAAACGWNLVLTNPREQ